MSAGSKQYDELLKNVRELADAGHKREEDVKKLMMQASTSEAEQTKLMTRISELLEDLSGTKTLLVEAGASYARETEKSAALEGRVATLEGQEERTKNLLQARQLIALARNRAVCRMNMPNMRTWGACRNEHDQLEFEGGTAAKDLEEKFTVSSCP